MNINDIEPFDVESWEDLAKLAIRTGQKKQFCALLSKYIDLTNQPLQQEIQKYADMRHGHWMTQQACEKSGKTYAPEWP